MEKAAANAKVENNVTWKQAKSLLKWGVSKSGLQLTLPKEVKPTKADKTAAKAEVNTWKNPKESAIGGVAFWFAAARQLTALGMSRKTAGMILDGRLKPSTMVQRAGLPSEVLAVKFEEPSAPVRRFQAVATPQPQQAEMMFFAEKTVAPTGATATAVKAKVKRLVAAGFSLDEALDMVGV